MTFAKAINEYLAKHGEVCTVIGRQFPVDVTESEQRLQSDTAMQMAVLEQAALVRSSNTTADGHQRSWVDHGRNQRGHAASIGQAQIQDRKIGVELLAELVGDDFQSGSKRVFLKPDVR